MVACAGPSDAPQATRSVQTRRAGAGLGCVAVGGSHWNRSTDGRGVMAGSSAIGRRREISTVTGETTRTAESRGSRTPRSPAVHVPITKSSLEVKVAELISGSPGTKSQPVAHPPRTVTSAATASTGIAPAAVDWGRAATDGDGSPATRPPSTHATIAARSTGDSVGSLMNAP